MLCRAPAATCHPLADKPFHSPVFCVLVYPAPGAQRLALFECPAASAMGVKSAYLFLYNTALCAAW